MPQTAPRLFLAALLLPVLLAGCDALYDDTKGWASRLEASLLGAGTEAGAPAPQAAGAAVNAGPAEMPAPPAVPVEAVAVTPLAAPAKPAEAPKTAEPEGVLAEASAALLEPAPEAPAKTPEAPAKAEPVAATPAAPKPKPAAPTSDEAPASDEAPTSDETVVAVVLHLSSLRSEEAARRQWSDLQKSFPEPLGDLQAEFRRTELGEKGTFYRVLAGPLPSRDQAGEVCAALKAKDARQYCRILPQQPKG